MNKNMILRTMLFVPASSYRMIITAATEGEDAVILDLEDACPVGEKETGRILARDCIPMLKEENVNVFVRVNSFDTGLTKEDLSYVVVQGLDGIMLPKAESKEDISMVGQLLLEEEGKKGLESNSVSVVPLLETPKGILAVSEIASDNQRVIGVSFGAGDYSREIGAGMGVTSLSPEENFLMTFYPRCIIALAARAAGILAIDSPFFGSIIDIQRLIEESQKAKLLGFTGKLLTHPRHINPINQVFSPSKEDIDFAKQVIRAYEEAKARGLGATSLGGRMVDYGSCRRAANLLSIAERIAKKEGEGT
jgi:citrate lyase subunit beta/citryl-CoA lyase